jgi:hypothetical protein
MAKGRILTLVWCILHGCMPGEWGFAIIGSFCLGAAVAGRMALGVVILISVVASALAIGWILERCGFPSE